MPVQRWRLTFERGEAAAQCSRREIDSAWEGALAALRAAEFGSVEGPRLVIGAALPVGMTAGHELADILLPERRRMPDVRALLALHLPADHRLVDLYDVWLGEPALPGLVVAGDYRIAIASAPDAGGAGDPLQGIDLAVRTLLDAADLPRARTNGERTVAGNLRPLILDVAAADSQPAGSAIVDLRMRLRFHPSHGTGRPEEVVAALSSILRRPLQAVRRHRDRLWLRGELPE